MEKGGGGRYEDAEHHRRNGDGQATVEEAHILSNPIIGSKWMLNDDDDDDYRQVNKHLATDIYPLPRLEELVDQAACHQYSQTPLNEGVRCAIRPSLSEISLSGVIKIGV